MASAIALQPLTSGPQFNWVFLLELIVCGILTLFFLFYFNRFFATLVSYGIRSYTWHYYRAHIDIQALQISLLGGRVFFKGIRYHGVNETILVQRGYITWNYWLRAVRKPDLKRNRTTTRVEDESIANSNGSSTSAGDDSLPEGADESGSLSAEAHLPCRIAVTLSGLEWFVYNRTPAYDGILSGFTPSSDEPSDAEGATCPNTAGTTTSFEAYENSTRPLSKNSSLGSTRRVGSEDCHTNTGFSSNQNYFALNEEALDSTSKFLNFLPVQLDCTKGAIVVGNEQTHSVLTVTFDKGSGLIDATDAGPLDIYRQLIKLDISHPVVQLRPNPDFKQEQLSAARNAKPIQHDQFQIKPSRSYGVHYRRTKRELLHSLRSLIPYFRSSVESFHEKSTNISSASRTTFPNTDSQWLGLTRYLDESMEDHEGWNAVEYARYSTILDCPFLSLTYYWDIPGKVPAEHYEAFSSVRKASRDINGATAPAWGMDLKIKNGNINYGPWADRERAGLQNAFFPNSYRTSRVEEALRPGSSRRSTKFSLRLEIVDDTTFRIPTREESKDWQWKGRANAVRDASKLKKQKQKRQWRGKDGEKTNVSPEIRPFGWFTLRIAQDSTITYDMDAVPSEDGFSNQLRLDLRDCKLSSSVNHGLLWQSSRQLINCDLSNPLVWNALHTWSFDICSHDLQLFLLRDHVFLITDLISDWTSNSNSEYYTFVPFVYNIQLSFTDLRLFLNVNDSNIISNPSDLDDNTFIAIRTPRLTSKTSIPSEFFKPEQSTILFDINLQEGFVDLVTPVWHTLHTFLKNNSIGHLSKLTLDGAYALNAKASSLTDRLTLEITGDDPKCYLYGFLIRYFMKIRENYFGEDMHFRTLEEFQEIVNSSEKRANQGSIHPPKKSNELDVIINLVVNNPTALFSTNIYDRSECLRLTASSLDVDLRTTSYYMDLQVDLTPAEVSLETTQEDGKVDISITQLFIDGLSIYGHRLFGLPPTEPTYVCNWDFEVGKIVGECSIKFLRSAAAALQNLGFTLDDKENAIPSLHPVVVHDATFIRAKIASVHFSVLVDHVALILAAGTVLFKFNDWSRDAFSKRLSLNIPDIVLTALDRKSVARRRGEANPVTYALLKTNINLSMLSRKANLSEDRQLQQDHIKISDQRTSRTPWLFLDSKHPDFDWGVSKIHPPVMIMPMMPEPVVNVVYKPKLSNSASRDKKSLSHKSSFLSLSGSSFRHVKKRSSSERVASESAKQYLDVQTEHRPNETILFHKSFETSQNGGRFSYREATLSSSDLSHPVFGTFSSWAMPHFHFYKVKPDSSDLPPLPKIAEWRGTVEDDGNFIGAFDDDNTAHSDVFFEAQPGIQGFCTSEFFQAISSLINGIQSSDPVDLIDSLQRGVISDIVKEQKAKEKDFKSATSLSLRIPAAVFAVINRSEWPDDNLQSNLQDQYQISCSKLHVTMQNKSGAKEPGLTTMEKSNVNFHASAEKIVVSAQGGQTTDFQERADFRSSLGEIVFWSASSAKNRSHLQMRTIEVLTSTKSAVSLACLIKRTTTFADSIASSSFKSSLSTSERLRYLVWYTTISTIDTPDPLFIIRPAYVLRGLQSHLRLNDSWKVISRLREMYRSLSLEKRQAFNTNFIQLGYTCPIKARESVLQNFNEWRPWDLAHVEKSKAMKKIWDIDTHAPAPIHGTEANLSCNVRNINIVIQPGPKQCDFRMTNMSVAIAFTLSVKDPLKPGTGSVSCKNSFCVRTYCSDSALRIRWEILDLVEGIAEEMSGIQLTSTTSQDPKTVNHKSTEATEIQVFFGTDEGSIILEGINLELLMCGYGLNGSFIQSPNNKQEQEQTTILLNAEDCSMKISSHAKPLMTWGFLKTQFYGSHTSLSSDDEVSDEWKLAYSCGSLIYDLKEDPLGFIHATNRVVEDEARYIRKLMKRLDASSSESKLKPKLVEQNKTIPHVHQLRVALFLDDYRLNFRLLPSLVYSIDGKVARMSVFSDINSEAVVDFDVKKNHHMFQTLEKGLSQSVSEIDIPPINGRVSCRMGSSIMSLKADITAELIKLEASSLRSLLSVFRLPQISHYVSDCGDSVNELKSNTSEILANAQKTPPTSVNSSQREILYNVRLTMAGWLIHARAPGLKNKDYSADMNFMLGKTQIHVDAFEHNAKPDSPNFHVNVSHIGLELIKRDNSGARSYGSLGLDIGLCATSKSNERDEKIRAYCLSSKGFDVQLYAETVSLVIDIAAHLQNRIRNLDLSEDMKRLKHFKRLARVRSRGPSSPLPEINISDVNESQSPPSLKSIFSVELLNMQISWIMDKKHYSKNGLEPEDLVFSIRRVTLENSGDNSARLRIQDTQLQIVSDGQSKEKRSLNSALMPEVIFNVAYLFTQEELRLAFQAAGKSLDLRFTTGFILPMNLLQRSIASAAERLREASPIWSTTSPSAPTNGGGLLGKRRLSSLLVDVDFTGAVVTLLGRQLDDQQTRLVAKATGKRLSEGKYGQYTQGDSTTTASLTSPGVALKVQYGDNGMDDPTLNAELRVSPSTNKLFPTVVSLIKQISSSVKELVGDQETNTTTSVSSSALLQTPKMLEDSTANANNPETILGRCRLNIGLRICKQEFSLSCQPIARVAATAQFEDIFMTVNTVQSPEHRRFFAILIACNNLQASVKHVYSNESTASFEVQSMVMSLMNSKHVSASSGISAILKVSPMKTVINAKQVQDFLLFREIWIPSNDEDPFPPAQQPAPGDSQALMVQRYQQVASADVFPWNAALSIDELDIQLDLGQTLGKADFVIKNFWASSKKTSDLEQNLCGGFEIMSIESKGRMSGSVKLEKMRVRTSIRWPDESLKAGQTPLIQASIGLKQLQANVSFEYQPFLVVDIVAFDFLMYNVRSDSQDRLVSILEGDKVQVFCTTLTASQSLSLYQTWHRLAQDKYAAYEASLKEIERFFRRKSSVMTGSSSVASPPIPQMVREDEIEKYRIKLHTDVVVTLGAINIGAFPSTFFDNQIFKMEALDAQARFAVSVESEKIHSSLELTLGQLRVALSSVNRPTAVEMKELSVAEVAARATGSRGGTILKVPRVIARMETWQSLPSNEIEYIFKSAFEGKVDVGWNYSRISFIRDMWSAHSRALADRLGKPLPPSAVRITGGLKPGGTSEGAMVEDEAASQEHEEEKEEEDEQNNDEKITAVLDVPQSKYIYHPREPSVIETPQLRDMGEATPPLEWIGLNRDRLPHITHQIVIVTLLEIAKEVSDAYGRILG